MGSVTTGSMSFSWLCGGEAGDSVVKRMVDFRGSTRLLVRLVSRDAVEDGSRPCTPATGSVVGVATKCSKTVIKRS